MVGSAPSEAWRWGIPDTRKPAPWRGPSEGGQNQRSLRLEQESRSLCSTMSNTGSPQSAVPPSRDKIPSTVSFPDCPGPRRDLDGPSLRGRRRAHFVVSVRKAYSSEHNSMWQNSTDEIREPTGRDATPRRNTRARGGIRRALGAPPSRQVTSAHRVVSAPAGPLHGGRPVPPRRSSVATLRPP